MNLHSLKPADGAKKKRKRIGRGNASGHGTTAGKGTKGQLSRSGGGKGPGFEGGQLPLQRRLPRLPGFTNIFKKEYQLVNIRDLDRFKEKTEVTPEILYDNRLVRKKEVPVKILGDGEIKKPLTVKAHAFSKKASEQIKKAGGKAEIIGRVSRESGVESREKIKKTKTTVTEIKTQEKKDMKNTKEVKDVNKKTNEKIEKAEKKVTKEDTKKQTAKIEEEKTKEAKEDKEQVKETKVSEPQTPNPEPKDEDA